MNKSKKIKAAVLLLVFSFNTLVGFACSVGFNFKENSKHHEKSGSHSHDKPHQHSTGTNHSHDHGDITGHHGYDEGTIPPHDHTNTNIHETPGDENNCCSDEVIKLSLLDKAITKTNQNLLPLPAEVAFTLSAFILATYNNGEAFVKLKPPLLRSWPLANHTDLRIVIQSFQI